MCRQGSRTVPRRRIPAALPLRAVREAGRFSHLPWCPGTWSNKVLWLAGILWFAAGLSDRSVEGAWQDSSTPSIGSSFQPQALDSAASERVAGAERRSYRIVWGGRVPRTWNGWIRLRGGRFVHCAPLGMFPDSAAVTTTSDAIRIRSLLASQFSGCDVEIEFDEPGGDAGAAPEMTGTLQLQLASRENSGGDWQQELALQDLGSDPPRQFTLDAEGSGLAISRVPGDGLKVRFDRDHLVFSPNESFQMWVEPRGPRLAASGQGILKIECRRAGASDVLWTEQIECPADPTGRLGEFAAPLLTIPSTEGVYDLRLELVEPIGFGLLKQQRTLAQRGIQLAVVASATPQPTDAAATWEEQFALDPARPERWTMRRQFSQIKFPARYPAPLGDGGRVVSLGDRNVLGLAPKGWQVYALPIDSPGQPHLVEIDYLASRSIALGISILEEDAAGQIPMTGVDAGVFIPRSVAQASRNDAGEGTARTHRFVFWPNSRSPYLALTNHDDAHEALVGAIRVKTGPLRLEPKASETGNAGEFGGLRRERLLYLHRPNLAALFNAPAQWDREQGLQLEDWRTVVTAADRLIQFVQTQGYTGIVVTVAADGSAIYPSRVLAPNPRLDNGAFFANGQDPLRKDVVELLYRLCDRAGLTLIPAVEFSGLLPGLEQDREFAGDDGIWLHTADGVQEVVPKDPADFRPPYNPLNPRVQEAMSQVVRELMQRGAGHRSYRGVSILLNGRSILALRQEDWGCDAETLARFSGEQGWSWPEGATPQAIRESILSQQTDAWLGWRSKQLAAFIDRLGSQVTADAAAGGRLYLMLEEESAKSGIDIATLAQSPTQAAAIRQPIRWGLQLDDLRSSDHVLGLPIRNSSWWRSPLSTSAAPTGDNRSLIAGSTGGQMLFHQASWAEFARLAELQVFPRHRGELLRLQQFVPGGIWAHSSFVTGLIESDPGVLVEGGWSITQALPDPDAQGLTGFTSLPQVPFDDVPVEPANQSGLLVVRQGGSGDARYFYAANLLPWPIEVELNVEGPGGVNAWRVLSHPSTPWSPGENPSSIRVRLAEFEFLAAETNRESRLTRARVLPPRQATGQMQLEILKLKSKIEFGSPGIQILPLANSNFEAPPVQEGIADWEFQSVTADGNAAGGDWSASLDGEQPFEGTSALRLRGSEGSMQLRSSMLQGSRTGRISVSAAVRCAGPVDLKLTLSGLFGGQAVARTQPVTLNISEFPTGGDWQPILLRFNDLPGELSDLQLTWTGSGSGALWLDGLEVRDYWLDDDESKALKQLINLASYKLHEQGDLVGCLRILEGYWPRFVDRYYSDRVETAEIPSGPTESARK